MSEKLYNQATSVNDLLILNIAFLKGIIEDTPYQGGAIASETLELLDNLILINQKGFLSLEGQPPIKEIIKFVRNREDAYIETEQRGYLIGYVHKSVSNKIKDLINKENYYLRISTPTQHIYNEIEFDNTYYNLTRDKSANTLEKLKSKSWKYPTNIDQNRDDYNFHDFEDLELNNELKDNYHKITIVAKEYNKGNIELELLRILETVPSIHIQKSFNPKLKTLFDIILYIINCFDSRLFSNEEFDILKEVLFFNVCERVKKLSLKKLALLLKKARMISTGNIVEDISDSKNDYIEDSSDDEDYSESENLYSKVKTFKDLLILNIAYLKEIINATPYINYIEKETKNHIDDLIRLNRKGFLTIKFIPAVFSKTIEKKSVLEGFIHKSVVPEIRNQFGQDYVISISDDDGKIEDNIDYKELQYGIEREKINGNWQIVDSIEDEYFHFNTFSNTDFDFSDPWDYTIEDIKMPGDIDRNIIIPNYVYVVIVSNRYGFGKPIEFMEEIIDSLPSKIKPEPITFEINNIKEIKSKIGKSRVRLR